MISSVLKNKLNCGFVTKSATLQKSIALALGTLLVSAFSMPTYADVSVDRLSLKSKTRVGRSDYRYEFAVFLKNDADRVQDIQVNVASSNPNSVVDSADMHIDMIPANSVLELSQPFVLVQNRRARFNEQDLSWNIDYQQTGQDISSQFSPESAYHTGEYKNYFVERGLATQEQVSAKINATYQQLFELVPDQAGQAPSKGEQIYHADFEQDTENWQWYADNGSQVGAQLTQQASELVITPAWQDGGDALAVLSSPFEPIDATQGVDVEYTMAVEQAYVDDGAMAVQMFIQDTSGGIGFFAYRTLTQATQTSIFIQGLGPNTNFGYLSEGFDFSQISTIGYQFLANGKSPAVNGNITVGEVSIYQPVKGGDESSLPSFIDTFDNGIAQWSASADNGSAIAPTLALGNVDADEAPTNNVLMVSPNWQDSSDAFTVKYQQFPGIDITQGRDLSIDISIPQRYIEDGNMVVQLFLEDANYQPAYLGYTTVAGFTGDEFITLNFSDVSANTEFGYISDSFDFSQLRGIGVQFVANNKLPTVDGDIQIDNVVISGEAPSEPVPELSDTTVLYGVGDDMAFIKAIDSNDIRSEGMSYGMMISVMMDDQETFDKLWRFTKAKMQNKSGNSKDFFAWRLSANAPYNAIDTNPAPDGEEYFAMALFLANNRWGSAEGIFDYQQEANDILHDMIFTKSDNSSTRLMMHPVYQQVEFVTTTNVESFSDPSYHLPAFYEMWALWADENNDYWHETAEISRQYLSKAAHPQTGLFSDYASHEGLPQPTSFNPDSHKSAYDSFRVMGNMAMDYHWVSQSPQLKGLVEQQVSFFENEIVQYGDFIAVYEVDGTREPNIDYRSHGRTAMNAVGATISDNPFSTEMLNYLWQQDAPTGMYRYYDGLLHMFGLLHAGGEFKIYKPNEAQ
ncbi:Reducing end xylose-releasing exo-oligoxylanase [Paraglaciecola mesophila]|uniref:cellulase n=1 Tax=Paraglaciecola mesophila TaxID=197222 RepID=A0A857JHF1_9ALTE|nr:glycosyl hydrolase family 8 [Paraglaciecola mesophila]QHJ11425.1 Reducing end xylose-releasing exo-oligoxylanase [Paraglaciecola mesophila]